MLWLLSRLAHSDDTKTISGQQGSQRIIVDDTNYSNEFLIYDSSFSDFPLQEYLDLSFATEIPNAQIYFHLTDPHQSNLTIKYSTFSKCSNMLSASGSITCRLNYTCSYDCQGQVGFIMTSSRYDNCAANSLTNYSAFVMSSNPISYSYNNITNFHTDFRDGRIFYFFFLSTSETGVLSSEYNNFKSINLEGSYSLCAYIIATTIFKNNFIDINNLQFILLNAYENNMTIKNCVAQGTSNGITFVQNRGFITIQDLIYSNMELINNEDTDVFVLINNQQKSINKDEYNLLLADCKAPNTEQPPGQESYDWTPIIITAVVVGVVIIIIVVVTIIIVKCRHKAARVKAESEDEEEDKETTADFVQKKHRSNETAQQELRVSDNKAPDKDDETSDEDVKIDSDT